MSIVRFNQVCSTDCKICITSDEKQNILFRTLDWLRRRRRRRRRRRKGQERRMVSVQRKVEKELRSKPERPKSHLTENTVCFL
jgi:hypothetical protein